MYCNFMNKAFLVKIVNSNVMPTCTYSVSIYVRGSGVVGGVQGSIFSENQDYKKFVCVTLNLNGPIF